MARIGFNDGSGFVYLRGCLPLPLNRFRSFTPTVVPVGPTVTNLGTGRRALWVYRTDYTASLELPFISARTYNGERGTVRAMRLVRHLLNNGSVEIEVEDDASTPSVTSWLAEGATPSLTLEDPASMLYTFAATFANTTAPYIAQYGGLVAV